MIYIIITSIIVFLLLLGYIFLYILSYRIHKKENKLIDLFQSRTDIITGLYEVSSEHVSRHEDIFKEILELRKKEFALAGISKNLESFIEIEGHIHHEINFIFQVCNKNPKLLKEKCFLYIRDVMIQRSSEVGKEMKTYNKIIEIYNSFISAKNYTLIGFLLPFHKKTVL